MSPTPADLQPQQYADFYYEEELPLTDLRPGALRLLGYAGSLGVGLLMLAAAVVPVPLPQSTGFVLRGTTPEEVYRFPHPVYVQRTYVRAGQRVRAGAPLLLISAPQVAELTTAFQRTRWQLEQFSGQDTLLFAARQHTLRLQLRRLVLTRHQVQRQLQLTERQQAQALPPLVLSSELARRRYVANQQLEGTYLAPAAVRELEQEALRSRAQLAGRITAFEQELSELRLHLNQLALDQRLVVQQLGQARLERQQQAHQLRQAYALAEQRLRLAYGSFTVTDQGLLLRAPQAGQITYAFDADKEVPAGRLLVKLLARPSKLYALASVSPNRIGYLRAGQPVVLKVATFPHYDWGTVPGTVRTVSLTPDAQGNYPFTVALRPHRRLGALLQIGMTGSLSVIAEEQTLLGLALRRTQQWRDELEH